MDGMKPGDLVQITRPSFFDNPTPVIGTIVRMPLPEEARRRTHHACILVQVGDEKRPRHIADASQLRVLGANGTPLPEIEEIWRKHREAGARGLKAAEEQVAKEAEERRQQGDDR
jgi:hypothetical protein